MMATKQELERQLSRLDEQIVSWGKRRGVTTLKGTS